jgi:5-methylcytosine-specific restriction enzyme subunit McrC
MRKRLSLVEYGAPVDLSHEISKAIGVDRTKADRLLTDAGSRVAGSLGLSYNPITVVSKGTRAIDFAGLIRLAPSLELEVSPKFLGLEDNDASWREDFFFLSTLSRHGRLLPTERLSSLSGNPRDLSTLVALSITSMYEMRKRRPLRTYRRTREADFFIEGDPDPIDLIFPSPDGFEQEIIRFDRRNSWNGDIVAAAKELLPEVRDPTAIGSLIRLIEDLSPQRGPASRRKPVPARHRAWRPLHDLCVDVLRGLGLSYDQGHARAPGYLVSTWRVWEDLLTVAARLGFGRSAVGPKTGFALGTKTKSSTGAVSTLSVFPDCAIEGDGTRPRLLLDAKYKGHAEKGNLRIAEADIYEALAFARAANCDIVVLAYPASPQDTPQPVGTCTVFEKARVDAVRIVGVQVESRRISRVGALRNFSSNLSTGISVAINT